MSTTGDDSNLPAQPNEPQLPQQPAPPVPPGAQPAPASPYGAPDAPVTAGESVSFAGGAYYPGTFVPVAPRRSRRTPIIVGVAALVLVAGGGAAWAVSSFLSGGGAQPESVVPATAIAYADVDLDPSAGQKIAAVRLLGKIPSSDRSGSDSDLMGRVVRSLLKTDPSTKVDYDNDIKPWLGKRAAIAAVPTAADATPMPLVVIQVTDEAKARTSLRKLLDEDPSNAFDSSDAYGSVSSYSDSSSDFAAAGQSDTATHPEGLVVRDGYALIGQSQDSVEMMSASAKSASLGASKTFTDDMKRAGDSGIASAWVDLDAAAKSVGNQFLVGSTLIGSGGNGGRVGAVLRIDGDALDLTAKQFGGTVPAGAGAHPGGPMLQTLPADTTGAVAIGDASAIVQQAYDSVVKVASAAGTTDLAGAVESEYGIKVPDDLKTLVGTGVAVSVGNVSGGDPQVAVKVRTDNPDGSKAVLDKIMAAVTSQADGFFEVPPIANATTSDGIAYALSSQYASALATAGTLGASPTFQEAVPDAATANVAVYVDFAKVSDQLPDAEAKKNLAQLKSFGAASHIKGDESTTTMRLVLR